MELIIGIARDTDVPNKDIPAPTQPSLTIRKTTEFETNFLTILYWDSTISLMSGIASRVHFLITHQVV
jgi:hypothetical protein